ncbi:transposase IS110 [Comamonas sp. E6]|nr:transposase IS110 [Comamonas sp. E6]
MLAGKHNLAPISQWVMALRKRSGWQKAAVALANKNARILWALMTQERTYEAAHISERPRPPVSAVA